MKICKKCHQNKSEEYFIKNKTCKGGTAGTCKTCQNLYSKAWKKENKERLSIARKKRYAETEGLVVQKKRELRQQQYPLQVRCELLRGGMLQRSKSKLRGAMDFDSDWFTTSRIKERLLRNPNCECCGKILDTTFKKDRKFNNASPSMDRVDSSRGYTRDNVAILCWECNKHKQDSTSAQLRRIADFMDSWKPSSWD